MQNCSLRFMVDGKQGPRMPKQGLTFPCPKTRSLKLPRNGFLSPNLNSWLKTTRQPDGGHVDKVVFGMLVTM